MIKVLEALLETELHSSSQDKLPVEDLLCGVWKELEAELESVYTPSQLEKSFVGFRYAHNIRHNKSYVVNYELLYAGEDEILRIGLLTVLFDFKILKANYSFINTLRKRN